MNRRELLAGAGAVALAACSPDKQVAAPSAAATVTPSADPFAGARLMADVESYVGFGTHRTGSAGDVATSDWFAKRWRELGYEIEQTEFAVPNADTKVGAMFTPTSAASVRSGPRTSVCHSTICWSVKDFGGLSKCVFIAVAPIRCATSDAFRNSARQACRMQANGEARGK